jgi:hypothetical protein
MEAALVALLNKIFADGYSKEFLAILDRWNNHGSSENAAHRLMQLFHRLD